MNSYTSTLVSNLVKSSSKNKIKTIEDLENSQLKIGFEEIPYIHSFLNVSELFLVIFIYEDKLNLNCINELLFIIISQRKMLTYGLLSQKRSI